MIKCNIFVNTSLTINTFTQVDRLYFV